VPGFENVTELEVPDPPEKVRLFPLEVLIVFGLEAPAVPAGTVTAFFPELEELEDELFVVPELDVVFEVPLGWNVTLDELEELFAVPAVLFPLFPEALLLTVLPSLSSLIALDVLCTICPHPFNLLTATYLQMPDLCP
jgi:hypothetical protein